MAMNQISWTTNVNVVKLIDAIHVRPPLWDVKDPKHALKDHMFKLWQEVALELDIDVDSLRRKYKCLRDTYRRELKKVLRSSGNGEELDMSKVTWPFFHQLSFLQDNCIATLRSSLVEEQRKQIINDSFSDVSGDDQQTLQGKTASLPVYFDQSPVPAPSWTAPSRKRSQPNDSYSHTELFDDRRKKSRGGVEQHVDALPNDRNDPDDNDDIKLFLMSLVPKIKRLDDERQSLFCLKVQEVLHSFMFQKPTTQPLGVYVPDNEEATSSGAMKNSPSF